MPKIIFVTPDGENVDVDASAGSTLMEAAVDADVAGIDAECGGGCSCATCHITMDAANFQRVGEANELEAGMLEFAENVGVHSRLSCQIDVNETLDGLVVQVVDRY
jgi:2Fe-2S ferredoxin